MRKSLAKTKSKKVYKSKVLYKTFRRGYYEKLYNYSPIAGANYSSEVTKYEGNKGYLTVKNAEGFITLKVRGSLIPCLRGFHAFEKRHAKTWSGPGAFDFPQRCYKIRLYNCFRHNQKWVGDSFEILERVTTRDLRPRRWRD